MSEKILYEDKHCRVTELYITIYKYFFPLATSKTIMFEEIDKIQLVDGENVNHMWGPSTSFLNNWFHMDGERAKKDKFISIKLKCKRIRPSLTPSDPRHVFDILRAFFAEKERKSI
jgi:hypothetical protein